VRTVPLLAMTDVPTVRVEPESNATVATFATSEVPAITEPPLDTDSEP